MVIAAGRTIEVDTQSAEVRTLTVEGTLRASRTAASRLWLYGNLIVRGNGVLDYGRPNDRVTVSAVLRWTLDERTYVGGHSTMPVATDVGLWATANAQVWMAGAYKDAWASLVESANAGATVVSVVPAESVGWLAGDLLLLVPPQGAPERRAIAAVLGPGRFQLASAVSRSYPVETVSWTDAWGQPWTEQMRPKVANLSATVRLEAADPNHRPHVIFMDSAKGYAEDIAIVNFSPAPKFVGVDPTSDQILGFGRYSWHYHMQGEGSRGSYLRRARLYDGVGDGLHLHASNGVTLEDIVIVNQSRHEARDSRTGVLVQARSPLQLESVDRYTLAATGCWIDRALIVGPTSVIGREPPYGHGVWVWRAADCAIVGPVTASQLSSGVFWAEGAGSAPMPIVLRAESYGNARGFFSWHNYGVTPPTRIVDLLAWRNDVGLQWGAYLTSYWLYGLRSLRNRVGINHMAAHFGLTDFLVDGADVGIEIGTYRHNTAQYSIYEDGIVRNVGRNLTHTQTPDVGSVSHVQFDRVRWHPGVGMRFGSSGTPLLGSDIRLRSQQGLTGCLTTCAANMTLYRLNQTGIASGLPDTNLNAIRVDGETVGARPARPRVRLLNADNSIATGTVTLIAESDATEVSFWNGHRFLGRASVSAGRATLTVNLASWPYRRAYFWAHVTGASGVENASRVIRVSRF